jgi:hypothetical protein
MISLPRTRTLSIAMTIAACSSAPALDPSAPVVFALRTTVPAGAEVYRCEFFRMPTTPTPSDEIFVTGGQHDLTMGTHHYLVYRTKLTDIGSDQQGVRDCFEHGGVMQYSSSYVTGGQTPHESADFPAGAALPFKSGEVLLVQAHFVNASSVDLAASVTVVLRTSPASAVEQRAGVLRFYDPFLYVPPHGQASATMRCPIPHDITLLSAGPHMHKHGVSYSAWLDPPGEAPSTEPLYTTHDWEHPSYMLGYIHVKAGSHVRYRCDYTNGESDPVVQGLSAERDEMCMFGGFYFPAMDVDDENCAGMDQHGTGTMSCADTSACLEACPQEERPHFETGSAAVGPCWQSCIARSCPNVTAALFPQLSCTDKECAAECATMGEPCRACVRARCPDPLRVCQELACDR